mgnify:FL=1|tara:strand:+ start:297 stop:1307 length:1011 start_codon:yes stop_codon:yes gene_type:complete
MKFIDETVISVKAGNGGDGCLSFRREKYIPFGGPDGGDGGNGGSVIAVAKDGLNTLADFRNKNEFRASNGERGGGKNKKGKAGEDLIIELPVGSVIYDDESGNEVCDLDVDGQNIELAKGGDFGLGNTRFKSSTNRAPRKITKGNKGESKKYKIVLKVLADVGLVGLPNVGKSSILAAISMARPKIADYEFTTLHPNLGVVLISDYEKFVVADIPGLIKGASSGSGLGIQFLKHISRTKLLLHVIDISDNNLNKISKDIDVIETELKSYDDKLYKMKRWYVFNKIDLLNKKNLTDLKNTIVKNYDSNVYFTSTVNKKDLDIMCSDVWNHLRDIYYD